jgi:hypothetical protein
VPIDVEALRQGAFVVDLLVAADEQAGRIATPE